jgi:hypothetical protein
MICGADATQHFGFNKNLPLCQNWACEQALIAEINDELAEAAEASREDE